MSPFDYLCPPALSDPTARAYKDWFHLNFFDLERGIVGLVNTSLHGAPDDRRSRAVGVSLVTELDQGWHGGIEITAFKSANIGHQAISLETLALSVAPNQRAMHASVRRNDDGVHLDLIATPNAQAINYDIQAHFGSGWISWAAMPMMKLDGELTLDNKQISLNQAVAYHDHNWGRWLWGDDAAREWGAFMLNEINACLVFARACDKGHYNYDRAHLTLTQNKAPHTINFNRIQIKLSNTLTRPDRRIPGALAAIHPDRCHPKVPSLVEIYAFNGSDEIYLHFETNTTAQLILAEPTRPGYAFINELVGRCNFIARIEGKEVETKGLGVFEYVE